ncbi:MAG TPA: Stk1 family PASTA domain-containing Ser/Thr kinase [Mycobacteriales bacterium]|nr:Stk1 family PASTA domain-containing Ser/Thr kinase [Mycobacteriales bacterium]
MTGTTVADPLPGTVLDRRYRVDAPIARGGMSTVYAGTDLRLDRRVAVKVMAPALAHDPAFTERFVREARTAARLSHPNAVAVFDQGAEETPAGRVVFLVMELVAGSTLREVLRRRGRLRPDEAVSVLEPILAALAAAHRAGLVHRDVKPENVLVSTDGTVKVVDFGLARAVAAPSTSTQSGMVLGTVAYVSPEQVARGASDARTDVYSAGILLFELLTGAPPYGGDSALAVAYRHVHDDVPPPSTRAPGIPPELDELVQRATRREPGGRPADAGAFLAELAMARTDLGLRKVPSREIAGALGVEPPPAAAGATAWTGPTGPTAPSTRGPRGTTALPAYERPAAGRPAYERPAAGRPEPRRGASRISPADGSAWPAEQRRKRTGRLVAAFLVLVFATGAGAAAWYFGNGRFVAVPQLSQLSRAQASSRVADAGLSATFTGRSSETVPDGRVIGSDPGAGGRVLRGRSITVVLSTGRPPVPVPAVAGQDEEDAVAAVQNAGLRPQVVEQASVEVEAGLVVSQAPAGGTAARNSVVRLVVSTGPAEVEVPDVRGMSFQSAQQKLAAAGFQVKVRALKFGNVLAQSPRGGTTRKQGTTVTIYGI